MIFFFSLKNLEIFRVHLNICCIFKTFLLVFHWTRLFSMLQTTNRHFSIHFSFVLIFFSLASNFVLYNIFTTFFLLSMVKCSFGALYVSFNYVRVVDYPHNIPKRRLFFSLSIAQKNLELIIFGYSRCPTGNIFTYKYHTTLLEAQNHTKKRVISLRN